MCYHFFLPPLRQLQAHKQINTARGCTKRVEGRRKVQKERDSSQHNRTEQNRTEHNRMQHTSQTASSTSTSTRLPHSSLCKTCFPVGILLNSPHTQPQTRLPIPHFAIPLVVGLIQVLAELLLWLLPCSNLNCRNIWFLLLCCCPSILAAAFAGTVVANFTPNIILLS